MRTTLQLAGMMLGLLAATSALAEERTGSWQGASGHTATGTVSIVEEGGTFTITLSDDWSVDRAPDPHIAFGTRNAFAEGTDFQLIDASGGQTITVPEGIDPSEFEAAWVWCKRFGVPLASAPLN